MGFTVLHFTFGDKISWTVTRFYFILFVFGCAQVQTVGS